MSSLVCSDQGRGPAVLLIHGFPLCRWMWQPQLDPLQQAGYRVIAPDLPGFGESPPLPGVATIDAYGDAVIALLDSLGIERAAIGGMSMGGYVLLSLAERYPERLAATLYLVTRAAGDDQAGRLRRTALAEAVDGGSSEEVPEAFERLLFAPVTLRERPELVGMVRAWMNAAPAAGVVGGLLAMRDRKDYRPLLPTLQVPALVIGAQEDLAIPPANAEELAAGLPDAALAILPAAGHMANLEQPEAFNRVLLEFLATRFPV